MAGNFTTLPLLVASQFNAASTVPCDTQYPSGSNPQSGNVPIGLLTSWLNVTDNLTAHAGGTQAAALALGYGLQIVRTVASGSDSVKLPPAVQGLVVFVMNLAAANSMQVFGSGVDTINAVATATGVAQAAGKVGIYIADSGTGSATVAGNWTRLLSA